MVGPALMGIGIDGGVGGYGVGDWPGRRGGGTKLAAELDRRLAGDEPLIDIIGWWTEAWRAAAGLYLVSANGDEGILSENFSANEHTVYILATVSGCDDPDRVSELQSLWPQEGIDGARMLKDLAYVQQLVKDYLTAL
jgi:hypothetical protein